MPAILGFSGSLRRGSYNSMLLAAAAEVIPIEIIPIREIPLYDGDREREGLPEIVRTLKERIASADGLLIATPEYNYSIPGVAKNAIDWLSRPVQDIPRVFGGLAVGTMGATVGRGGTILSQAAWLQVFRALQTRPFFGRALHISGARDLFDEQGLRDQDTLVRLERFVREFADFVAQYPRRP